MKRQTVPIILIISIIAVFVIYKSLNGDTVTQQRTSHTEKAVEIETVSDKIPDFSLPDTNGKPVSIMSVIAENHITIVDFWASWCNPCINEMPNIKTLYERYDVLGIIGISLDEDRDKWLSAIKGLGISWIQLSDLEGWNSKAAKLFNVNSIPYTIVVSQDGTILAAGLRGESLKDFIDNKFKE